MSVVAADLAIAIPIAMALIIFAFSGVMSSQSYMQAYAKSGYYDIKYYSISQQMILISGSMQGNSTNAIQEMGKYYNVSVKVNGMSNYSSCIVSFCRIVEIGGNTKILEIG